MRELPFDQSTIVSAMPTFLFQVELLKGKLGFDDAFNYKKESDLKATLKRLG